MKHDSIQLNMQAIKFQVLPEFQLTQGHLNIKKKKKMKYVNR